MFFKRKVYCLGKGYKKILYSDNTLLFYLLLLAPAERFYLFVPILSHFWCSVVTSVTFIQKKSKKSIKTQKNQHLKKTLLKKSDYFNKYLVLATKKRKKSLFLNIRNTQFEPDPEIFFGKISKITFFLIQNFERKINFDKKNAILLVLPFDQISLQPEQQQQQQQP